MGIFVVVVVVVVVWCEVSELCRRNIVVGVK